MRDLARRGVFAWLLLLLTPVIVAIWSFRWFVTQDGPAHLYAATILRDRVVGRVWGAHFFAVNLDVPNVTGHVLLGLLSLLLPPRAADQIVMTVLSAGLAAAMLWLQRSVRPDADPLPLLPLVALLPLNRLWLLGFYNFLFGTLLFALVLGVWWRGRERMSWRRVVLLSIVIVLIWFSHPIAFGATALSLGALALVAHGRTIARTARTAVAFLPTLPFAIAYARMAGSHGEIAPALRPFRATIAGYLQTIFKLKFLALSSSESLPFSDGRSPLFVLLAPSLLAAFGVVLMIAALTRGDRNASLRGWEISTTALLLFAILGPDSLGSAHGEFLRERVFLLGVVASVPLWTVPRHKKAFVALTAAALCVQTLFVVDYAIRSDRAVGDLMRVEPSIGAGASVYPITIRQPTHFRAMPERHAANLLGTRGERVVWRSYESELYYFPVTYRDPLGSCGGPASVPPFSMNQAEAARRPEVLDALCTLWANRSRIDTVVTFGESDLASAVPPEYKLVARSRTGRARVYSKVGPRQRDAFASRPDHIPSGDIRNEQSRL